MLLDEVDDQRALLVDAGSGQVVTAGQIRGRASSLSQSGRRLAFLMADGSIESAWWFLALVEAQYPVALLDADNSWHSTAALMDRYLPDIVIDPAGRQIEELVSCPQGSRGQLIEQGVWLASECGPEPHEDLAVLLPTSGSTGNPKLVRLSAINIRRNAEQIVASLDITADDRGVTALPLFYSFGMSVLTSHALVGSSVLVTKTSVLEESFWSDLVNHDISLLPGVPATYSMLKRLGFDRRNLPRLRALTQAGGRLAPELVTFFHELMVHRGGRFFVMYGQTEASPRISCLPSESLPAKLGSVGIALDGGHLSIRALDGGEPEVGEVGEVLYQGPNVMMGYAESRADLVLGPTHGTILETGDLGYLDAEGFLYLTGRIKRICKLAGTRVSLDDVESLAIAMLSDASQVGAIDSGEAGVTLFVVDLDSAAVLDLRRQLARRLRIPPKLVNVCPIEAIPLLPNGKTDYAALERLSRAGLV